MLLDALHEEACPEGRTESWVSSLMRGVVEHRIRCSCGDIRDYTEPFFVRAPGADGRDAPGVRGRA